MTPSLCVTNYTSTLLHKSGTLLCGTSDVFGLHNEICGTKWKVSIYVHLYPCTSIVSSSSPKPSKTLAITPQPWSDPQFSVQYINKSALPLYAWIYARVSFSGYGSKRTIVYKYTMKPIIQRGTMDNAPKHMYFTLHLFLLLCGMRAWNQSRGYRLCIHRSRQ